jgi:hypothetical protein
MAIVSQGIQAGSRRLSVGRVLLAVAVLVLGFARPSVAQIATPTVQSFAQPALTTVGVPIRNTATIVGMAEPFTGTVTFQLFADATCSVPIFTSTNPVGPFPSATSDQYVTVVPGTYHWVARYNGNANNNPSLPSACDNPSATVIVAPGGAFVPLTPARIEDTRLGAGGLAGPFGPGATRQVQVTGRGGVPEAGVSAVVVNVTVTQPTGAGYLTLYPSGGAQPVASNLNFTAGRTIPNLAVVKVGPDGRINVFNSAGDTHVILDVTGYYADRPRGGAGQLNLLDPARIADSRFNIGGAVRLGPGASLDVTVAGQLSVPVSGAEAVVLNVAATETTATSYLTVHPSGEPRPLASNLNFVAGETVSNRVMTKLGANGKVTIYNDAGSTDIVVDLNGWYSGSSENMVGMYAPKDPVRIVDTRLGVGAIPGPLPTGGTIDVQVTGQGGLPARDIRTVILNVTVTGPSAPGYLTLYRSGGMQPATSDLNYAEGETRANLAVVRVGGNDGRIRIFTSAQTHVVVDVAGYFS